MVIGRWRLWNPLSTCFSDNRHLSGCCWLRWISAIVVPRFDEGLHFVHGPNMWSAHIALSLGFRLHLQLLYWTVDTGKLLYSTKPRPRAVGGWREDHSSHCGGDLVRAILRVSREFLISECGPTATEYAVMLGLVIGIGMVAGEVMGVNMRELFEYLSGKMDEQQLE